MSILEEIKLNKKDMLTILLITMILISAYLLYVLQATKEIPFIYNQF